MVPCSLRLALALALTTASLACNGSEFPGSQNVGTFDFLADVDPAATPEGEACVFDEMPTEPFTFTGTFTRDDPEPYFFTLGDFDRDATFDGQVITAVARAPRQFEACDCSDVVVEETLSVAFLSASQAAAIGSQTCPANPLTGGVPAPGGDVTPPGPLPGGGFDAVLACGELIDRIHPDPEHCACGECYIRYPVRGERRQ